MSRSTSTVSQATTSVLPQGTSLFNWSIISSVFNPQTGLYEKRVTVTNNTGATVSALRVFATGLPATLKCT